MPQASVGESRRRTPAPDEWEVSDQPMRSRSLPSAIGVVTARPDGVLRASSRSGRISLQTPGFRIDAIATLRRSTFGPRVTLRSRNS
jgi:hypothetical protein